MRPITLCTLQWGDLPLETVCQKAKAFGYDGLELGLPAHLDVRQTDPAYYQGIKDLLSKYDLKLYAVSNHLVSQAICDNIDERHRYILPDFIWGEGDPEKIKKRAVEYMIQTAHAVKSLGIDTIVGFTGSSVWHMLYPFPPALNQLVDKGYQDFADRFTPIMDEFQKLGVKFAFEVHPTEIAFDTFSAQRALDAIGNHPAFGFNFDPSHLAYQGVDYVDFIYHFSKRIFHVHMKDVYWSDTPKKVGVFGGHVPFGNPQRYWDFRSLGHGKVEFEEIIRALNFIGYRGPLSVEWEDNAMDREMGAEESCKFVKAINFESSEVAFDANF